MFSRVPKASVEVQVQLSSVVNQVFVPDELICFVETFGRLFVSQDVYIVQMSDFLFDEKASG